MPLLPVLLAILCTVFAATSVVAQYKSDLVLDLAPGPDSSRPSQFVSYGGFLFFKARGDSDDSQDYRLYKYDADSGAVEKVGIVRLPSNSGRSGPVVYDDRLFFSANDGQSSNTDFELWSYDVADDLAQQVSNIEPSPNGANPSGLTVYNDRLYFGAYTGTSGRDLWSYDAVADEVSLAANFGQSGLTDGFPPFDPVVYDGRLFFRANQDGVYGLWAYDGVSGGVELILGGSHPNYLTAFDNRLFFSARSPETGAELWSYAADGAESILAVDLQPGPEGSIPHDLLVYEDRLFFSAAGQNRDYKLWRYDADEDDASIVFDRGSGPSGLIVYDGRLFFSASDAYGSELWTYDPDSGEAHRVTDIAPGGASSIYFDDLLVHQGRLFLTADDGQHGHELWAVSPANVSAEGGATWHSAKLSSPYPNPARVRTIISFELDLPGPARVEVLDLLGRRTSLVTDATYVAGEHTLTWQPNGLSNGVYIVRLTAGNVVQTQRLTLIQ